MELPEYWHKFWLEINVWKIQCEMDCLPGRITQRSGQGCSTCLFILFEASVCILMLIVLLALSFMIECHPVIYIRSDCIYLAPSHLCSYGVSHIHHNTCSDTRLRRCFLPKLYLWKYLWSYSLFFSCPAALRFGTGGLWFYMSWLTNHPQAPNLYDPCMS